MVEVCAVNMFMTACANREITNLSEISMQLPFLLHLNCALSIAVKSYLDELSSHEDPTSADTKAGVKETATTRYFPQSQNFVADLQSAFEMWDAVAEGVTTAGTLIPTKDQDTWKAAVQWLSSRR
ncbi:hypothetical protein EJ04DRAFT_157577 [Polyplosphaeria fusca]|uniref:Post-transcriptional regulator MKT1 C-terminal domain-containing protein n=1 Tax=Polyplosphaeria fusca TaxID=682080 RepID=A0A9P4R4Y3_9PLEO|nr:hypothetical protein EJ04DRAFT_157577 [Polyplosphaeria fusca]